MRQPGECPAEAREPEPGIALGGTSRDSSFLSVKLGSSEPSRGRGFPQWTAMANGIVAVQEGERLGARWERRGGQPPSGTQECWTKAVFCTYRW